MPVDAEFDAFMAISAVLTGYNQTELYATGCAAEYLHQFRQVTPVELFGAFIDPGPDLYAAAAQDPGWVEHQIRNTYLASEDLGPLARALIQLWYLGQWMPLPPAWRRSHGASKFDVQRVVSTQAYKEGLVWDAIGAHPMGAKQQGFGAWALEPPSRKR